MKLMTKAIRDEFKKTGRQEGDDAKVIAKFFTPWSNWTWYATEFDDEDNRFFGVVAGDYPELGYFSLDEFEQINGQHGLIIERDMYWSQVTLGEVKSMVEKEYSHGWN